MNDASGNITVGNNITATGTTSAASLIPTGSSAPTNGVYLPAANTVSFATASTERFRIGSSGQFGIGGATYGTSGQVLTSGGSGAAPTWSTPASGSITSGTRTATTSGTTVDYTGIASTAKRVTVLLSGVSMSGSADLYIQIGTSGGIVSTGYASAWSTNNSNGTFTAAFGIRAGAASIALSGAVVISLLGSNEWSAYGVNSTAGGVTTMGGNLTLGATLDRVRIITSNGTDTFDAGAVNIFVES